MRILWADNRGMTYDIDTHPIEITGTLRVTHPDHGGFDYDLTSRHDRFVVTHRGGFVAGWIDPDQTVGGAWLPWAHAGDQPTTDPDAIANDEPVTELPARWSLAAAVAAIDEHWAASHWEAELKRVSQW